jgi:hypothetical protein
VKCEVHWDPVFRLIESFRIGISYNQSQESYARHARSATRRCDLISSAQLGRILNVFSCTEVDNGDADTLSLASTSELAYILSLL